MKLFDDLISQTLWASGETPSRLWDPVLQTVRNWGPRLLKGLELGTQEGPGQNNTMRGEMLDGPSKEKELW